MNLQPSRAFAGTWQLTIIPALALAFIYGSVGWALLTLVMFPIYTILGHHVGLHRYFTHAQFKTNKLGEAILAVLGCVGSGFSPASYVIAHSIHHRNSDTMEDVHGPQFGAKSLLFYWHNDVSPYVRQVARNPRVKEIIRRYKWVHNNFKLLIVCWAALLTAIDPMLALFGWWLPSCLTMWSNAFGVYLQHDEKGAIKSNWYGWINLGEMYHDVHHDFPRRFHTGRFDITYYAAQLFVSRDKNETNP